MILILLAALIGAAQEVIVVYEGATTNHFVAKNPGNSYNWGVYINFSPDTEAPPDDYEIMGSAGEDKIKIKWLSRGIFYLKVTETDLKGCENLKILPVNVISNNNSIGFLTSVSSSCFNTEGNGFSLSLMVLGDNGQPLTSEYFPLVVEFSLNGVGYSQQIYFNNQEIQINNDWLNNNSQNDFSANIEILSARDFQNVAIPPDINMKLHTRSIFALPLIEFETPDLSVEQGLEVTYKVKMVSGKPENSLYKWSLSPETGTTTDLNSISGPSAPILWNGPPGYYSLQVQVKDGDGCISETISQQVLILEPLDFTVNAGRDTIIGNCSPYQLQATVEQQPDDTYAYLWKPATNLDDPAKPNPVFTPGSSTKFVVTVTNDDGVSVSDTVKIEISDLIANAGDDVYMEQNSSTILDGSASAGSGIQFNWTTLYGKIDSGENTAHPVVSGFGTYYLEITDFYGCLAIDSINIIRLTHAPVANDDYDTTRYLTEVKIPVLHNDTDPENSIVPATLNISIPPVNGTAYVDFDDYTIHYRPNEGFSGSDNFEYTVCNTFNKCDQANVYILVSDFKFLIPNAFSPNGDGINDYFEILGIDYYEGNSITIINRWGNKVYEAKNYGISTTPKFWDGKANTGIRVGNEELPTGTYYYILDLGNGEKPIGGSIYLDR
jgi:gliding motility-associated-like protein